MNPLLLLTTINALIDGTARLIAFYNSLPDSDEGLKAELDVLKALLDQTVEKVKAYTPLEAGSGEPGGGDA